VVEPARSGCLINAAVEVRAELLADGGPDLWTEFMAELRTIHLGEPEPERDGPSVMERLAKAYAAAF